MNGSTFETCCIQAGSWSTGTFAPVKTSSTPNMMFASTACSRSSSPKPAPVSPRPVHENAQTAVASASGASDDAGTWIPTIRPPTTSANAATKKPLTTTGQRPTEEERQSRRGADEDVSERVLEPLPADRERHREQARDRRVLHRVPDHEELVGLEAGRAADVDEEQDLEDRRDEHRRDVDLGPEEREQRPEAEQPADEEDAHAGHASASVPARRALESTVSRIAMPIAR